MNPSNVISKLKKYGFSEIESQIYAHFYFNKNSKIEEVIENLDFDSFSIRKAVQKLYFDGYLNLEMNEEEKFSTINFRHIIDEFEKKHAKSKELLNLELNTSNVEKKYIHVIKNEETIISKLKELINKAKDEIYLNTDYDLILIKDEIEQAIKRGVKVLIFSFNQSETYNLDADFYYHSKQGKKYCSSRFMLVCDYKYTLNVLKNEDSILTGNYSNDKTYAKIISEHIHQDIYLASILKGFPEELTSNISINSEYEKIIP